MSEERREIDFTFRKWDGSPHWVHPSILLGEDGLGVWLGQSHEMISSRPGATFAPDTISVTVLPPGSGWVATFFPPAPGRHELYVDIVADLDVASFTAIDLDLDVIVVDGLAFLDDEDEFAEHRMSMGYPPAVAAQAERDAHDVLTMVRGGLPPFDGRAARWLKVLAAVKL